MSLSKKVNLIIYRFREKGLEVFLLNDQDETWNIPQADNPAEKPASLVNADRLIELDPVQTDLGTPEEAWAVEGEWHDIPSLKSMLYEDAQYVQKKFQQLEQGTFVAVKEALKKVMPHQYKMLKELKDILIDRNSVKDI